VWSKSGALLSQVLREAVPDGEPEEVECSPWP
jgi:hypothetical protein